MEMVAKGWPSLQSVNWAADGSHIFVSAAGKGGSNLLRIDMQGDAQVLWEQKRSIAPWNVPYAHWLGGPSAPWAVPSSDGRRIDLQLEPECQQVDEGKILKIPLYLRHRVIHLFGSHTA